MLQVDAYHSTRSLPAQESDFWRCRGDGKQHNKGGEFALVALLTLQSSAFLGGASSSLSVNALLASEIFYLLACLQLESQARNPHRLQLLGGRWLDMAQVGRQAVLFQLQRR